MHRSSSSSRPAILVAHLFTWLALLPLAWAESQLLDERREGAGQDAITHTLQHHNATATAKEIDDVARELASLQAQAAAHEGKGTQAGQPAAEKQHATVAICTIMKNEQGNAREWINYHHWLGVGKFYVFDHGSRPPMSDELSDFVQSGLVEVLHFGGNEWQLDARWHQSPSRQFLSPQGWAYDNCFRWFGMRHKWIGLLDVDEFLVIKQMPSDEDVRAAIAAASKQEGKHGKQGKHAPPADDQIAMLLQQQHEMKKQHKDAQKEQQTHLLMQQQDEMKKQHKDAQKEQQTHVLMQQQDEMKKQHQEAQKEQQTSVLMQQQNEVLQQVQKAQQTQQTGLLLQQQNEIKQQAVLQAQQLQAAQQQQQQQAQQQQEQQQLQHGTRRLLQLDPEPRAAVAAVRPDIARFLIPFEKHGGLMVHWQLIGPSGHVKKPANATMFAYTQCIPKSEMQKMDEFQAIPLGFMKSFTSTKHYSAGCNPHQCTLDGASYVNEGGQPLSGSVVRQVHWDRIVVLHYVTRSIEEYTKKMRRGSGHSQYLEANRRAGRTGRTWNYFMGINDRATDTCSEGAEAYRLCCAQGMCEC